LRFEDLKLRNHKPSVASAFLNFKSSNLKFQIPWAHEATMTYERFEDLPAWKAAIKLAEEIYGLTARPEFKGQYCLRDQLERAAVSISNNIAEGFERGTTQELITFLYIARGSAGEVRSMLCLIERLPAFTNLKSQAEDIGKQIRNGANYLQSSEIKGQRHLTEKSRHADQQRREREAAEVDRRAFDEELRAIIGPRSWNH
jgi:four helix bundle protein